MQIIPKPLSEKYTGLAVDLRNFRLEVKDASINRMFKESLFNKFSKNPNTKGVFTYIEDKAVSQEGYVLIIGMDTITVKANGIKGAFYAAQTVRIAAGLDTDEPTFTLKEGEISDKPRYSWRGLMLDEARHFFGKDAVKRLIELMSLNKLNVLHWHLTDDQGWRIEILKYPRLTEIGSKRPKSQIHGWGSKDDDGIPHSGYYTQRDIREIVDFALERNVMIVPEIDMPAHFAAAFAAYPELACREIIREVPWYFGGRVPISKGIWDWNRSACIGKAVTFEFIYNVIDEIIGLFPAPYFHIGGDEAPKGEWKKCPHCRKLMDEKGLKTTEELQSYFINEVNKYVLSKGRELIGWNEILEGGNFGKGIITQYWTKREDPNVLKHLEAGGKVIMSKHQAFYFDMCYSEYPLSNTYYFSPYITGITDKYDQNILGVEGALWTEWIPSLAKLYIHLFPRLQALAENAWSGPGKDFANFIERLNGYKKVLDYFSVNYAADSIAEPVSKLRRYIVTRKWHRSDQDFELNKNAELKLQKKE